MADSFSTPVFLIITTFYLVLSVNPVQRVIQVEMACPAFIVPAEGSGALAFHRPAFEAAVEEANRLYKGIFNFSITFLGNSAPFNPLNPLTIVFGMESANLMAKWYFSRSRNANSVTAVITPGNIDYAMGHQLTSHWNILCMTTMGSMKSGYTIQPQTTMIALSIVSLQYIITTVNRLLATYDWTKVYAIIDMSSPTVYDGTVREWDRFTEAYGGLRLTVRRIETANLKSFAAYLKEFKDSSRVLYFSGNANQLRRLLIEAYSLNLTTGEFVYIYNEPYEFPKQYGFLDWKRSSDSAAINQIAKAAFRSVLAIHVQDSATNISVSGTSVDHLTERFRNRTKDLYNISLTAYDQPVPDILSSYASIFVYAQVLNETLTAYGPDRLHDGIWISEQFLKRVFHSPGGLPNIYVDEAGHRKAQLVISQYPGPDAVREPFLEQSSYPNGTLALRELRNLSETWPGRWPPLNEPLCGYRTEKSVCREESFHKMSLTIGSSVGACLVSIMMLVVIERSRSYRLDNMGPPWWQLTPEDFGRRVARPSMTSHAADYRSYRGSIAPAYTVSSIVSDRKVLLN